MRQAGRYLPEYHDIRRHHGFWEILRTPALGLELAKQPLRRFDLDAAIVFSDILVLLQPMGAEVEYGDSGPVVKAPFAGEGDLGRLEAVDVRGELSYVGEAVERLVEAVGSERAVIGFCGAPMTMAAYFVDGGPKKQLLGLKALSYTQPALATRLLEGLAEAGLELLKLQIEAGADAVQIFDSWSWYLGPEDYRRLALPPVRQMVEALADTGVPVIYYVRGAASHLEAAAASGAQVLSVDSSVTLAEARQRLVFPQVLQGNLDPAELAGPADRIARRVTEMIEGAGAEGLIANLGQGLTPDSPVEGVAAFVDAVHGSAGAGRS